MQTMTAPKPSSLKEARELHERGVDHNRRMGVVTQASKNPDDKVSDRVFEVQDGYYHTADGRVLGPGARFHPMERQITKKGSRGRTALDGKARELTQSEYMGLSTPRQSFAGADIGLRSLDMTRRALEVALEEHLDVSDFAGIEPIDGRYTLEQVQEIVAAKQS